MEANNYNLHIRTPQQRLDNAAEDILSFGHINVNGINSHDNFVELTNTMGILDSMGARECIAL